jgi:hypothetical protein
MRFLSRHSFYFSSAAISMQESLWDNSRTVKLSASHLPAICLRGRLRPVNVIAGACVVGLGNILLFMA